MLKQTLKNKQGFTFIESLVLLFVVSVVIVTFYSVFTVGTNHIIESKNRLGAISLANQEMEVIRNLAYNDVAVVGGVPSGSIDPNKYVAVNTRTFHVFTDIKYYDDPFDGVHEGTPDDTIPYDYKTARVTIKWGNETGSQQVYLAATFVPPGVETSAGGGTLIINATDSGGQGVPSTSVYLFNSETGTDHNTVTDADGHLALPGTQEASLNTYEITLAKSGYETVSTFPPFPTTSFHPNEIHASVSEGALTQKDITINLLSDTEITTVNPLGDVVGSIEFNLLGGRILGTENGSGDSVYNYGQNSTSDAAGKKSIEDISPGTYKLKLEGAADTNYALLKVDLGSDDNSDDFVLPAGVSIGVDVIIADKSIPSFIIIVTDDEDGCIENASVKLVNAAQGYDVTLMTDKYGKAYFPHNATTPLQNDNYNLTVSATGFNDDNSVVVINNLTNQTIELIP